MTMILPTGLEYGYARGRFLLAVGDSSIDPDRLPDPRPASGTFTFTPINGQRVFAGAEPVTVGTQPVICSLDNEGRLIDQTGMPGVWLVTGQYTVSPAITGINLPTFVIEVTAAHTEQAPLDLSLAIPMEPAAPPHVIPPWAIGIVNLIKNADALIHHGPTPPPVEMLWMFVDPAYDPTSGEPLPTYSVPGGEPIEHGEIVRWGPEGIKARVGSLLGPDGRPGPRGLPGAGAVPTGEAIAEHIATPGDARDALLVALSGVSGSGLPASSTVGMIAVAENAAAPQITPTYDGSGQATHPSVLYIAEGFGGFDYWMGMTPYAGGNSAVENPSILASRDGYTWEVPAGLTNPLALRPTGNVQDFNSDTHLVYTEGYLYCFWRSYQASDPATSERFYYRRSRDGATWEPSVLVKAGPTAVQQVSPAFIHDQSAGLWYYWAVDTAGANTIQRFQAPSPSGPWTGETVCTGFAFPEGREAWHFEVLKHGGEYVALAYVTTGGTGTTGGVLWRLTSADGVSFTRDSTPAMRGIMGKWDQSLYKASLVPAVVDGSPGYRMWYGGTNVANEWRIGHTLVRLLPSTTDRDARARASVSGMGGALADTFSRPNATTPGTLTTGQAWTQQMGTSGITSGRLYSVGGVYSRVVVDAGASNIETGVTLAVAGGEWFLEFRYTDTGNYMRVGSSGTTYMMEKRVAGAPTQLASTGPAPASGDRVRVRFAGDQLSLYVNGVLTQRHTVTDVPLGTKVALVGAATVRYDDFYAMPI